VRTNLIFAGLLLAQTVASNALDGTWRIDSEKTKLADRAETHVYKDGRYQCLNCNPKIDVKLDGTPQPLTGSPYADQFSAKVVDENTIETKSYKNGKVVDSSKNVLRPDGNTIDVHYNFYPADGSKPGSGRMELKRVANGPAGAHAQSGSWKMEKWASGSENILTFKYVTSEQGLTMSTPTGQSYTAKIDGTDYPVKGDPSADAVSLKRLEDGTIEEIYKRDRAPVFVNRIRVSPDGRTLTIVSENKQQARTDTFIAQKQ
jgi:hypothetical protein